MRWLDLNTARAEYQDYGTKPELTFFSSVVPKIYVLRYSNSIFCLLQTAASLKTITSSQWLNP